MKDTTKNMTNSGTKIGIVAGIVVFALFGMVPGAYLGSYAALAVLASMSGGTVEPTLIMRALIVVGALIGVGMSAIGSIVSCALAGAGLGFVADALFAPKKAEEGSKQGV